MTFPSNTAIGGATTIEASGVGTGSTSKSGQTVIYSVTNAVNIPAGVILRLEVWNLINPTTPAANLAVQVVTKDSGGGTIDSGTSNAILIKQIGTGDIADNAITTTQFSSKLADNAVTTSKIASDAVTGAKILDGSVTSGDIGINTITTPKIATDSVTADKIAGVTKLIFVSCTLDFPNIPPQTSSSQNCSVPGLSGTDTVVATNNGVHAGGNTFFLPGLVTLISTAHSDGTVGVTLYNANTVDLNPDPQIFGVIVFQP